MEEFASNLELIEYLENKIDALTTKEFYYINQVEKLLIVLEKEGWLAAAACVAEEWNPMMCC